MTSSIPRIVMKFGGTSIADADRIKRVAWKIKKQRDAGCEVAVVVSAMAGETNRLLSLCQTVSESKTICDEYDAVIATGEQVTSGLLALALRSIGVQARSWQGWQIPFLTDLSHGKSRIISVDGDRITKDIESGIVPVIAGFQGINTDNRVTTLGRGGSDTSAVALAASLKATRCDIYTDVDGIYTTDPRIVKSASKLRWISYEEMLELASVGAKVLQTRSVELAMKKKVRIQVLSSFIENNEAPMEGNLPGSLVVGEEEIVEKEFVVGITYSQDEAKVAVCLIPDKPGVAAAIFGPLAEANINVDMIVQAASENGITGMTFTIPKAELSQTINVLEKNRKAIGYQDIQTHTNVAKISIIGIGMKSNAGVAGRMFTILAERGINIQVISTSEIKVSVLVAGEYTELALRALHTAFYLDEVEAEQ